MGNGYYSSNASSSCFSSLPLGVGGIPTTRPPSQNRYQPDDQQMNQRGRPDLMQTVDYRYAGGRWHRRRFPLSIVLEEEEDTSSSSGSSEAPTSSDGDSHSQRKRVGLTDLVVGFALTIRRGFLRRARSSDSLRSTTSVKSRRMLID
ncbi:hypothetical protein JAAARDRAFT_29319 [Jaapia argillacea MUCL 33604]|uniref:Uncharacterized protein n=1 Tax=Jaapia argillacea MUCL 33604 TaxID=933084 RepID=A0A067QL03_9AGAM|nr:hypothetical protein JAAARDRAFT_29319 [Jaapia argillacea MUCL 33604]